MFYVWSVILITQQTKEIWTCVTLYDEKAKLTILCIIPKLTPLLISPVVRSYFYISKSDTYFTSDTSQGVMSDIYFTYYTSKGVIPTSRVISTSRVILHQKEWYLLHVWCILHTSDNYFTMSYILYEWYLLHEWYMFHKEW